MNRFEKLQKGINITACLPTRRRFQLPECYRDVLTQGDREYLDSFFTLKDYQYIHQCGFDHVRIHCLDALLEVPGQPFEWQGWYFDLIERAIQWSEAAGLAAVLVMDTDESAERFGDPDRDGALIVDEGLQERFIAAWEALEKRLSHKPYVIFELMNAITTKKADAWNDLTGRCVAAIRALNPNRGILIGAAGQNHPDYLEKLNLFEDENIGYTFRFYEPLCFTHQQSALYESHYRYNRVMEYPDQLDKYIDYERFIGNDDEKYRGYERVDRPWLQNAMNRAVEFKKAHPDCFLYLNEMGAIRVAPPKCRINWIRDMVSICKEHDIVWCVYNYLCRPWDIHRFSLVNDDTRLFLSQELLQACLGNP